MSDTYFHIALFNCNKGNTSSGQGTILQSSASPMVDSSRGNRANFCKTRPSLPSDVISSTGGTPFIIKIQNNFVKGHNIMTTEVREFKTISMARTEA
jgi:transcription initiation factor TFIID subunit TAF12